MTAADVEAVDYARFGALIITGTVLAAEPSRSATFRAFDLARTAGLPLIFDVDYRPYSWPSADEARRGLFPRGAALCDVIVGNDVEFGFMAGDPSDGLDKARSLIATARRSSSTRWAKRARSPSPATGDSRPASIPTEALKPTGAGDGFLGGFSPGLARGQPVQRRRPARLRRRRHRRGPRRLRPRHADQRRT